MMQKLRLILVLGLILTTAAKDVNNYFSNPSSRTGINPEWAIGDQQVISWKTTIGAFNISLWQQSMVEQAAISQVNIFTKIHASDDITNFTWVVQTYNYDLEYSNVFFLWINADRPDGFISSYFNITKGGTTSKTTTATTSSTGTAFANSTDTSSQPSPSPSSDDSPEASSTELTMTGKIALGVGLGVGVPILAALAALIWLKRRNGREAAAPAATSNYHETAVPKGGFTPPTQPPEMGGRELPAQYYPELPSQKH